MKMQEPTQPTIPGASTFGSPSTTTPTPTPTPASGGSKISPNLQNPGILEEADGMTYKYAIGVRGRKVFDESGKLVRYEGYRYYDNAQTARSRTAAETSVESLYPSNVRNPKYFSGDEDQIFNMSLEDLSSLQRSMNAIGLLGDKYSPGVADNATRAAFTNLLEVANGYGEEFEDSIMRLAASGGRGGKKLTQYRVSSEADVKAIISRVSRETLGRNLAEGDLTRLAQMYRNLEREAGLAAGSETQQQVVAAPSPETFAESQLGQMFPEETNARQFGSYLEAIKEKYQI